MHRPLPPHKTEFIEREDGGFGWRCSCGQESNFPWTKKIATQQMRTHKREHAAYAVLVKKLVGTCGVCLKPIRGMKWVGPGEANYHKDCVIEAIKAARTDES